MTEFKTVAHQVGTEQRHAAARDAATALVRAASPTVLDRDITRMDTVLAFGQNEVAEQIMQIAPCGHGDCALGGAVMLASELALRLAKRRAETRPKLPPVDDHLLCSRCLNDAIRLTNELCDECAGMTPVQGGELR